jgi:hypothetical protein
MMISRRRIGSAGAASMVFVYSSRTTTSPDSSGLAAITLASAESSLISYSPVFSAGFAEITFLPFSSDVTVY